MARAATQIETELTGKDNVSKVFDGVSKKARKMQSEVNKGGGGGFSVGMAKSVAVGNAMFSVLSGVASRAASAAGELGTLSDRAQQMQVSAEYAQKFVGALGQVGVKGANIENMTKMFDKMTLTTGRVGADGFEKTLADIAAIGDEQKRVTELGRIFGREMGPALAPLLRQGPQAFKEGLADVMAAMPAVSTAAVNAGDGIADAWAIMNDEIKVGFQSALGNVANYMENNFGLSFKNAIRTAIIWVKWGVGIIWGSFKAFGENIGMLTEFFVDDWRGALDWVVGGITAWAKASISPFIWIFDTVKGFAVEFGKAFVRWITGDKADWAGALDKALAKMGDASKDFKAAWADLAPTTPPGREWSNVNLAALEEQREQALAAMRKGLDAENMLASAGAAAGADLASTASKAASKISNEMKDAKYVSASSYEALKIMLDSSRNAYGATGFRSLVGVSSRSSSVKPVGSANGDYMTPLREILSLQRSSVKILEKLEVA